MKIVDGINHCISENRRFFGLEFFPPMAEAATENLYIRMERIGSHYSPLFSGMTWGCGASTAAESIEVASTAQSLLSLDMQVNLTGAGATEADVRRWLTTLKARGIQNLLLLRGDLPLKMAASPSPAAAATSAAAAAAATPPSQSAAVGHRAAAATASASTEPVSTPQEASTPEVAPTGASLTGDPVRTVQRRSLAPAVAGAEFPCIPAVTAPSHGPAAGGSAGTSDANPLGGAVNTSARKPGAATVRFSPLPAATDGGLASNTASSLGDFPHAVDLVRFVRREFGSYFGIAVAGYPEQHHECPDRQRGLQHLKEKVDAGADIVITQFVFDAQTFLRFCTDCQALGIRCPIIPGIMPIQSYAQFRRYRGLNLAGTAEVEKVLAAVKNDDAEVKRAGVLFTVQLIKTLLRSGVRGVYFFTMNMETVVASILDGLDFGRQRPSLPWQKSCDPTRRDKEERRPIHWAARPQSYLARTAKWDEFPNGRFGSTLSPAYREDATYHTQLLLQAKAKHCTRLRSVSSVADVCAAFVAFLDGQASLPWADELSAEAGLLMEPVLLPLNARGFLTINSQPAVNGAHSENKIVGWGPLGGFVYQRAYLEFFASPQSMGKIVEVFSRYPSLSFMGMSADGAVVVSSAENIRPQKIRRLLVAPSDSSVGGGGGGGALGGLGSGAASGSGGGGSVSGFGSGGSSTSVPGGSPVSPVSNDGAGFDEGADGSNGPEVVTTVTWGVFPNREVIQPTIVATSAFSAWVPEAFDLWGAPFGRDAEMPPVIADIRSHWVLFNVVDNDYVTRPTPLNVAIKELCDEFPPLTAATFGSVSPASVSAVATTTQPTTTLVAAPSVAGGATVAFAVTDETPKTPLSPRRVAAAAAPAVKPVSVGPTVSADSAFDVVPPSGILGASPTHRSPPRLHSGAPETAGIRFTGHRALSSCSLADIAEITGSQHVPSALMMPLRPFEASHPSATALPDLGH